MLSRSARAISRVGWRGFAAQTAKPAAPAAAADATADPEHQAWLQTVKGYKVVVPRFDWTLEWALPTPVPQHQFTQSPVVIEVTDRNTDPEKLVYDGPNVVGGYSDPESPGKLVSREEHKKRGYGRGFEKEWIGTASEPAGAGRFKEHYSKSH